MPIFHIILDNINFSTIKPCKSRGNTGIVCNSKNKEHNYTRRGFQVTNYHDDKKISKLQEDILSDTMQIQEYWKHTEKPEQSIKKSESTR